MVTGSNGVRWRDHVPLPQTRMADKRWLEPHLEIAGRVGFSPSVKNLAALACDIARHMQIHVLLGGEEIVEAGLVSRLDQARITKAHAYGALKMIAKDELRIDPAKIALEDAAAFYSKGGWSDLWQLTDIFVVRTQARALADKQVHIELLIGGTQKRTLATLVPGEMRSLLLGLAKEGRVTHPDKPLSRILEDWETIAWPEFFASQPGTYQLSNVLEVAG